LPPWWSWTGECRETPPTFAERLKNVVLPSIKLTIFAWKKYSASGRVYESFWIGFEKEFWFHGLLDVCREAEVDILETSATIKPLFLKP
jgi:hypothetical protein